MATSSPTPQIPPPQHSILHNCACFILVFTVLLVLGGCLVIWLDVNPRRLSYRVESAIVQDFKVYPVFNNRTNTTEEMLRTTFFVTMSTINLNHRVSFNYETIAMRVECKGQTIAFAPVEPFVHDARTRHEFNSSLTARNVTLLPATSEYLKTVKKPMDPIMVDVKLHTRASLVPRHWRTDHRKLKIVCSGVVAHFSTLTTFEKTDCSVEF